jgi:hypothetical protein
MSTVSRRAILKSIGLIGLGAAAATRRLPRLRAQTELPPLAPHWQGQPLGRVTGLYQNARVEPNVDADVVLQHNQDDIVRVRRVVHGQSVFSYNDLWLETEHGYMYSSYVQPMWFHLPNVPQADLGDGRWAEVTVPYTDAYWDPDDSIGDRFVSRMYYGCIYRVTDLVAGRDGKSWYKVQELYQSFHMRATHMRLIRDEDLAPISPEVDPASKWIDVNLMAQVLVCYEGDTPVFAHRIASGLRDWATPEGTHYVFDKRISERMVGGRAATEEDSDLYNLAGVPFVCYFTSDWVATHGTFWHNDYGQPHSHGCVNLPSDAARFVWRWTHPIVQDAALDRFFVRPPTRFDGTRVVVHY